MRDALIGHTGFVGGNLARQAHFDDFFNSQNVEDLAGKSYCTLVCAGAPAQKWLANREPAGDRACVRRLARALGQVRAERVILISTVDVFPFPVGVDEDALIDWRSQHPYGRHRHELEEFVRAHFASLVVRLPGLFGPGLKKNVVYDFLHGNGVDQIHCRSMFQFYCLDYLWRDIQTALAHGLPLVHLATEPVSVAEVASEAFGLEFRNAPPSPPARYDFRTKYAPLFGGAGGYVCRRDRVLADLRQFVQAERRRQGATGHLQPGLAA